MLVFHIGLAWNALTLAQGQENMTPAGALNAVGTGEGLPVHPPPPPPSGLSRNRLGTGAHRPHNLSVQPAEAENDLLKKDKFI